MNNNNCNVEMTDAVKIERDVYHVEKGMETTAVKVFLVFDFLPFLLDTKLPRVSSFFSSVICDTF